MSIGTESRNASVRSLAPFVPAKDFEASKKFYADLGFALEPVDDGLVQVSIGQFSFLLQDYYAEQWAGNFVMHMLVDDLNAWWAHIAALDLAARYGVESPRPPKLESWGLNVAYVFDPSGVLWHFAEAAGPGRGGVAALGA
ncbi:MAG TPA: VOC family protein [Azospirillaceae bacterium]|nr:VOC family protein [Azospirillaceae bacterium]